MNMASGHMEQDDMALYAMDLLSPEETKAAAAHIATCAECSRELAIVRGDLALFAHSVDRHSPPALARERLMKQVSREKRVTPVQRESVQRAVVPQPLVYGTVPQEAGPQLAHTESPEVSLFRNSGYSEEEYEQPRKSVVARVVPWFGWAIAAGLAVTAGEFYHQRDEARGAVNTQSLQMAQMAADAAALAAVDGDPDG